MKKRTKNDFLFILDNNHIVKTDGHSTLILNGKTYTISEAMDDTMYIKLEDGTAAFIVGIVEKIGGEVISLYAQFSYEYDKLKEHFKDYFDSEKGKDVVSYHIYNDYCYTLSVLGAKHYCILVAEGERRKPFANHEEIKSYIDTLPSLDN